MVSQPQGNGKYSYNYGVDQIGEYIQMKIVSEVIIEGHVWLWVCSHQNKGDDEDGGAGDDPDDEEEGVATNSVPYWRGGQISAVKQQKRNVP